MQVVAPLFSRSSRLTDGRTTAEYIARACVYRNLCRRHYCCNYKRKKRLTDGRPTDEYVARARVYKTRCQRHNRYNKKKKDWPTVERLTSILRALESTKIYAAVTTAIFRK